MANNLFYSTIASPIGELIVTADEDAVTGLYMEQHLRWGGVDTGWTRDDGRFECVSRELTEYFAGDRRSFTVPLAPAGTEFQRSVWDELREIPFGETTTYGALAKQIGNPRAAQAVGAANGSNPISILIPCHRVVGPQGELTGYAGGLERKRFLLELEGARSGSLF